MQPRLQTRYPSSWRNLRRRRQPPVIGFSIRRLRHLQFSTTLATRPTEFQHAGGHQFDFTDGRSATRSATLPLRRQVHRTISTRPVERTLCSETAAARRAWANASTSEARAEDLRGLKRVAHVHRPQHCKPMLCLLPHPPTGEFRGMSDVFACLTARQGDGGQPTNGRQDKSAAVGRAHVVGWVELFAVTSNRLLAVPTETPRLSTSSAPSTLRRTRKQTRRRDRRSVANGSAADAPAAGQRVRFLRHCVPACRVAEPTRLTH
jgi:hypothetical protein